MTVKELQNLVEKGESLYTEFKSWIKSKSKKDLLENISREAVSFANAEGGNIIIGVEDDGEITGCIGCEPQNIISSIYERTMPHIFSHFEQIEIDGKTVVVIKVEKSSELHALSSGEVLKRLGKENKPVSPYKYSEAVSGISNPDYSAFILENTSKDDINPLEVYRLKEKIKERFPESNLWQMTDDALLKDLGLAKILNRKVHLTVAGLLFVGKDSAIKEYL